MVKCDFSFLRFFFCVFVPQSVCLLHCIWCALSRNSLDSYGFRLIESNNQSIFFVIKAYKLLFYYNCTYRHCSSGQHTIPLELQLVQKNIIRPEPYNFLANISFFSHSPYVQNSKCSTSEKVFERKKKTTTEAWWQGFAQKYCIYW